MHIKHIYVASYILEFHPTLTATILNDKLSLIISLDLLKAKEQWLSQTQYIGRVECSWPTDCFIRKYDCSITSRDEPILPAKFLEK